jgi:hypothetical protein
LEAEDSVRRLREWGIGRKSTSSKEGGGAPLFEEEEEDDDLDPPFLEAKTVA